MLIDVWADVACPFCYLGLTQLRRATADLPYADQLRIRHHSFQLEPDAPETTSQNGLEALAEKFGQPVDEMRAMAQATEENARAEGLRIDHEVIVPVRTFDAHRLVHFATGEGLQFVMLERLYEAYFANGEDVADHATLVALGAEVGLEPDQVADMLHSDAFTEVVEFDIQQASQLGITGVPFFVFDEAYSLSGAKGADTIRTAIEQVWQQRDGAGKP